MGQGVREVNIQTKIRLQGLSQALVQIFPLHLLLLVSNMSELKPEGDYRATKDGADGYLEPDGFSLNSNSTTHQHITLGKLLNLLMHQLSYL
jgi:hypothetical protein